MTKQKPIVVFGTGKISEVVTQVILDCQLFEIAAYACDPAFLGDGFFLDKKVVDFSTVEQSFPPDKYDFFVALGYHELNNLRARKVDEVRRKGYMLVSVVHPRAHLYSDLRYGDNCFIMDTVSVHPRVTLGHNVFVWAGTMIGHHSVVGSHVWLTSGANVSGNVNIGDSTFLAVNATIGHSVTIGRSCFIGANALATKNVNDETVLVSESTKPFRLNSRQFLRISNFSNI